MVCVDTNAVVRLVQCEDQRRLGTTIDDQAAWAYFQYLRHANQTISLPAPVVTEYLIKFDIAERGRKLLQLSRLFRILPIDTLVAARASELWFYWEDLKSQRHGPGRSRQEFRVDTFIVAAALYHRAAMLITSDTGIQHMATELRFQMPVQDFPNSLPVEHAATGTGRQPRLLDLDDDEDDDTDEG